jgi:hypothetical protein
VRLWVADGRIKKAVASGGVCVYKYMCSAYVFCVYVVAINYVCLEHVQVCQHGCAAVQVFGCACTFVVSGVCVSLIFGGRGGGRGGEGQVKKGGPAHCMLGTNGHVLGSAYVRVLVDC